MFTRRRVMAGATALGGASLLPGPAHAKGSVVAATYPGTWEDAYRAIVAPALKKAYDIDLELQPLFAVDQVAKAKAARGAPPFDAFVLDPGPRITAIQDGLFDKIDIKKIGNASKLPAGLVDGEQRLQFEVDAVLLLQGRRHDGAERLLPGAGIDGGGDAALGVRDRGKEGGAAEGGGTGEQASAAEHGRVSVVVRGNAGTAWDAHRRPGCSRSGPHRSKPRGAAR